MHRAAATAEIAVAASLVAIATAGCSTDDEGEVPVACKSAPGTLLRALERAPDPVTLDGTPISECFAHPSDTADVQAVGFGLTEAATELAAEARTEPESDAALELGYLVAAARAGAAQTPGIYDELVRRLGQELQGVDTRSKAFTTGEQA
ncbi:MAG: hypothetical protein ACRDL4_13800, partial [Thermoleophilaceae bacterium]